MTLENRKQKLPWPKVNLGAVVEFERAIVEASQIVDGTAYVGLENIESGGMFVGVRAVCRGELASSKFAFDERHLLYGKLRPYLAKIARPKFSGVCSTDILPILPGPRLDRDYLNHLLLQPDMVALASSRSTGANLPRLSPKAIAEFVIPLPPLPEQRRIADILDRADALRAKRRAALAQLDTLTQAIFLHMFGRCWTTSTLDLAANLKRGPFGGALKKEIFVSKGFKVYEQRNAIYNDFSLGNYYITDSKYRAMEDFAVLPNDLIVSCSGTLGKVAIAPEDVAPGIINQALLRVRPRENVVTATFLKHALESKDIQMKLSGFSRGTGLQNFPPMSEVKSLLIPLPTLDEQQDFGRRAAVVENLKNIHLESMAHLDALFAVLQHRAFRGELEPRAAVMQAAGK